MYVSGSFRGYWVSECLLVLISFRVLSMRVMCVLFLLLTAQVKSLIPKCSASKRSCLHWPLRRCSTAGFCLSSSSFAFLSPQVLVAKSSEGSWPSPSRRTSLTGTQQQRPKWKKSAASPSSLTRSSSWNSRRTQVRGAGHLTLLSVCFSATFAPSTEPARVFRHRLGEHSLLQRQHALLCDDSEEAEPAGERSHH